MTPRKELFLAVKNQLKTISALELIDLQRGQFEAEDFPKLWTAALIKISAIDYETMTESNQEGNTQVEVTLYCKDGWMDQQQNTTDPGEGYNEIDLLDEIAEALQFLNGEQFKPLQQSRDEDLTEGMDGIFAYKQIFTTKIYRKLKYNYTPTKIKIDGLSY